jgi:hypothetical protein
MAALTSGGRPAGSVKAISAALVSRRYPLTDRRRGSGQDRWGCPILATTGCGPSFRPAGLGDVPAVERRAGRRVCRERVMTTFSPCSTGRMSSGRRFLASAMLTSTQSSIAIIDGYLNLDVAAFVASCFRSQIHGRIGSGIGTRPRNQ